MKVFITGGGGMVGKNIIAKAQDYHCTVIAPGRSHLDLANADKVLELIEDAEPDVVIHCAGLVGGIQANIAAPYEFCYQNVLIGMNVIEASRKAGIKKLINLGSSCMYPREANNPLSEHQLLSGELEPTNEAYAIAKIVVAKLAEYLSVQYGLDYKTYIPCNLYGYWDKFSIDKSHMIPAVIRKIDEAVRADINEVDIWGSGTARREFMFASDLADFLFFSLKSYENIPSVMNVGVGHDYSINEYYKAVADVIGYEGEFSHDLTKPEGMKQKLVDTRLQKELGWIPPTSLEEGIKLTHEHYLNEVL